MKFHLYCSCLKCKIEITTANLNMHFEKCQIKKCLFCESFIEFSKKFCNSSCSAKYNNLYRTKESRQKQAISVSKTMIGRKNPNTKPLIFGNCVICDEQFSTKKPHRNVCDLHISSSNKSHVKIRNCPKCNKREFTYGRFQHKLCPSCRPLKEYRNLCNFTHDLRNYPNEYDLSLLEEYGMFHPKKNPKGVSRDHMYSVHDGYHNKVDPAILKHPANCSIMLQVDNTIKHSTSSITYEDLLERIRIWDEKYN